MPDLGFLHPLVVHFAVALLLVGVLLRWLGLTRKLSWASPAAVLLLLLGTTAAVVAVASGKDAHELAEGIPGAAPIVREHEELGERTRNVFAVVAALEIGALLFRRRERLAKGLVIGSAVVGLLGAFVLYEAAEHGGELVYSYAGGVGTRTGAPEDVGRLLIAGLHHQARLDRDAGRKASAAQWNELAAKGFPADFDVQLAYADSLLNDRGDGNAAVALLRTLQPAAGFPAMRHGFLLAQALKATGAKDEGRKVLEALTAKYPQSRRLQELLKSY